MCLAIPGQIVEIVDEELQLAKADVSGVRRTINIGLLNGDGETIELGDWVLIHVGFALSKIDETEAANQIRALEEIGEAYRQEMQELSVSRIE